MELVISVVKTARSLRAAAELTPKQRPECYLVTEDDDRMELFNSLVLEVTELAKLSSLKVVKNIFEVPPACGISVIDGKLSVYLVFEGLSVVRRELDKFVTQQEEDRRKVEALTEKMVAVNSAARAAFQTKIVRLQEEMQNRDATIRNLAGQLPYELSRVLFFENVVGRFGMKDVARWKLVNKQWKEALDVVTFEQA